MSLSLPSLLRILPLPSYQFIWWTSLVPPSLWSSPSCALQLRPQRAQPLSLICPSYQEPMTRLSGTSREGRQPLIIPMIIVPGSTILQEQTILFFFFLMTQKKTKLSLFSQETKCSISESCLNHKTAAFLDKMSFSALLHHLAPSCLIARQLHLRLPSLAPASVHTCSAAWMSSESVCFNIFDFWAARVISVWLPSHIRPEKAPKGVKHIINASS